MPQDGSSRWARCQSALQWPAAPGWIRFSVAPGMSREETFAAFGLPESGRSLALATFRPPPLELASLGEVQFAELAAALDERGRRVDIAIVITGSNSDPEGRRLTELAEDLQGRGQCCLSEFPWAALSFCHQPRALWRAIRPAGFMKRHPLASRTVNIGDHVQKGRLKASSVLMSSRYRKGIPAILAGMRRAMLNIFRHRQILMATGMQRLVSLRA